MQSELNLFGALPCQRLTYIFDPFNSSLRFTYCLAQALLVCHSSDASKSSASADSEVRKEKHYEEQE
jgi:hypothetical protein